jgi:rhodanese-related sulfurtransferase
MNEKKHSKVMVVAHLTLIAFLAIFAGLSSFAAFHYRAQALSFNAGYRTVSSAADLDAILEAKANDPLLVDLRDGADYEIAHIPGFLNISLKDGTELLETWITPFRRTKPVVLICYSGNRSARAFEKLVLMGFTNITDVTTGYAAYAAEKGAAFVPEAGDCGCPK